MNPNIVVPWFEEIAGRLAKGPFYLAAAIAFAPPGDALFCTQLEASSCTPLPPNGRSKYPGGHRQSAMPKQEDELQLLALKNDIADFVRNSLPHFRGAGERIDARYGVSAFRLRQAQKLRGTRKLITRREIRLEFERQLRARTDATTPPSSLSSEKQDAATIYIAVHLDVIGFEYARERPPTRLQTT
jgi:hypothetical protein